MKVYQLLRKKENWTQGALARSKTGRSVAPDSPSAACWCPVGALLKFYGSDWYTNGGLKLGLAMGNMMIGDFNDTHTHAEVLAACRKAGV